VNPVGAMQNQHARVSSQFTEEGKPPRNEKDEGKEEVKRRVGKAQACV